MNAFINFPAPAKTWLCEGGSVGSSNGGWLAIGGVRSLCATEVEGWLAIGGVRSLPAVTGRMWPNPRVYTWTLPVALVALAAVFQFRSIRTTSTPTVVACPIHSPLLGATVTYECSRPPDPCRGVSPFGGFQANTPNATSTRSVPRCVGTLSRAAI